MIQTLPLSTDDVAVTHLPGGVTVSTRAVRHEGARPGTWTTNYETMILFPGGHVDGPDTRDRAHAGGQHVEIVAALMAGAPMDAIGRVEHDEPLPEPDPSVPPRGVNLARLVLDVTGLNPADGEDADSIVDDLVAGGVPADVARAAVDWLATEDR